MACPALNGTIERSQAAGAHGATTTDRVAARPAANVSKTASKATSPRIDAADVQGLVLRGYGKLPECRYVLLQVRDGRRACEWLGKLLPRVTSGQVSPDDAALQIAFTHAGLAALGLDEAALSGFSREFIEGMVSDHRSRFLGDEDDSHPAGWRWGGPSNPTIHVLLAVFADTAARLHARLMELRASLEFQAGLSEVLVLEAATLSAVEHFGFADGISQPSIEGYHEGPSTLHRVKAGEFLLGYVNEYGLYTDRPLIPAARDPRARLGLDRAGSPRHDLGRNGTYLVFRQLRQDVPAFRATVDGRTRRADGSPDPEARALLAAKMVGRWPSGASLVLSPDADEPAAARSNEFRYHREDPDGQACPIGSHVRRANPRDALDPTPGSERSLGVNRRHRLIRRGRSYGAPLPEGATDTADRGIFFIALNANISRQFEFVQHSWILDPRFNGLYAETDPIAGGAGDNQFSVAGAPTPTRVLGLPRFVNVVGGAYFFLPSLGALRFLSELAA
jgi:Dyp-type peroxidase family